MKNKSKNNGFTLVEIMIVVAIIGILSGVAYPSYQEFVRRGARAEARVAVQNIAQLQERNFTDRGIYLDITAGDLSGPTNPLKAWASYNWSGSSYAERKYNVTVAVPAAPNNNTFAITAAPTNGFTDPKCGALTLDNTGTRGSGGTGSVADCWR